MIHKCLLDNFLLSRSAVCCLCVTRARRQLVPIFQQHGERFIDCVCMQLQGVPKHSLTHSASTSIDFISPPCWCGSQIRSGYDILRSAANCWWSFLRMWSGDTISVLILSGISEADCSFKSTLKSVWESCAGCKSLGISERDKMTPLPAALILELNIAMVQSIAFNNHAMVQRWWFHHVYF